MFFRESTKKRDCSWTWTHNHLVHKRTINHLAKLAKCLRSVVSTYLYGAFDCMFLSLSRKRFKVNPHSSLAKWLSVCLRTKWLWVRVMLQLNLQFHLNFRFRACFEQGVPWDSGNYGVWIHSETRTWHDMTLQSRKTSLNK